MRTLLSRLEQIADTPLPILLMGETGTGKEVAARLVHGLSNRPGAFVAVDCGALSPQLVESELFGHERGAFTGAVQRREGLVRAANRGTFFLDEIGELTMEAQTRLLRILQEGTYRPIGAEEERSVDLRVIAATWRNLSDRVREGKFRRDLYHRLAVVELEMPALRRRVEDVDLLWDHFVRESAAEVGRTAPETEPGAREHLRRWPWPGNVRELMNAARYVVAMSRRGRIGYDDLPPRMRDTPPSLEQEVDGMAGLGRIRTDLPYMEARRHLLDEFQRRYVRTLLDEHGGNISAAARAAEMDRRSIQRILSRKQEDEP